MLSIVQVEAFIKQTLVIKSRWCWNNSSAYFIMIGEFLSPYIWNGNSFNLVNPFNCTSIIAQLFCTSHCTRSVGSFTNDPISIPNVLPGVELRRQICTGAFALPESGMLSFILHSCKGMLAIRGHWVLWWESRNNPEGLPKDIVGREQDMKTKI